MHGDGACGMLKWAEFEGDLAGGGFAFAVHFVRQYFKLEGSRTVAQHEAFLEALHGDMSVRNQWMNNRVGFVVSDLESSVSPTSTCFRRAPF